MLDLFEESTQLQRIDLMARLISSVDCGRRDKELAVVWIAELTSDLLEKLDDYDHQVESRQNQ